MDGYDQCRNHWANLGRRAKVCELEEKDMCGGTFRCQKYRLESQKVRRQPKREGTEINKYEYYEKGRKV
jgi:hypothetical protein